MNMQPGRSDPSGSALEALVGKLRDEIIESQKARVELTKWKAILMATIGAAAFGLGQPKDTGFPALLALLPPACLYVDILCMHHDMRMMVIGVFLRQDVSVPEGVKRYEDFCEHFRYLFGLENLALTGTTVMVAILVIVLAFVGPVAHALSKGSAYEKEVVVMSASAVVAASGLLFLWKTTRLATLTRSETEKSRLTPPPADQIPADTSPPPPASATES